MSLKKKVTAVFLAVIMVASLCCCGKKEEDTDKKVSDIISKMTIEQKVTQMIVIGLRSDVTNTNSVTALDQDYKDLLKKYDFGGVLLMNGNFVDTAQTVDMIYDIQEAAVGSELGIPMFISTDQEGGRVNRVNYGIMGPGNMALAASDDTGLTRECAKMIGQEISSLGCNVDFAPVSDVNNNPNNPIINVRSFSDAPELVAKNVGPFIQGLKESKMMVSLKHFPGHGNVSEDSHTHLPCADYSLEEIKSCELIPFEEGIKEGADMIMTAHIQYPEIEKETYISKEDGKEVYLPATLSRKIMKELLRDEMGFEGLIVTDAMLMDAIATHFDPIDAATMTINADVDLLLEPVDVYKDDENDDFSDIADYINGIVARVKSGEISESELDDSVERILKCKIENGVYDNALSKTKEEMRAEAERTVASAGHLKREWEMAEECMTLIKNDDLCLPFDGNSNDKTLILYPNGDKEYTVDYALTKLEDKSLLNKSLVTAISYEELSFDDEKLQSTLKASDRIIVITMATEYNEVLGKVFNQAEGDGKKTLLLSLNMPYTASCYKNADAVLCGFCSEGNSHDEDGNGPFNLNVAVAISASFGDSVPQGKLPLIIPEISEKTDDGIIFSDKALYERGYGLMNWGE